MPPSSLHAGTNAPGQWNIAVALPAIGSGRFIEVVGVEKRTLCGFAAAPTGDAVECWSRGDSKFGLFFKTHSAGDAAHPDMATGEQGLTKSSKIQTSETTTTEFYGQTQCDYADRVHLSQLPNEHVEDDEPRKSQAYIHYLWDKCNYCEDWKFGDEGNIFVKFGGEAAKVKGNVAIFTVPALQANVLANAPVFQIAKAIQLKNAKTFALAVHSPRALLCCVQIGFLIEHLLAQIAELAGCCCFLIGPGNYKRSVRLDQKSQATSGLLVILPNTSLCVALRATSGHCNHKQSVRVDS